MDLTIAQESVIKTKGRKLLVSASAGSGKTFVVIERILDTVINDKIDIDRLLVLTFTNAAASELRERLVKKLYEKLDEYEKAKDYENVKYISKQIRKTATADISTIHSFCLSVIKNNFYVLGIDPNVTTLDETKADIMIQDALIKIIEEEYESGNETFLQLIDILGSEENLISNILSVYNFYTSIVDKEGWLNNSKKIYGIDSGKVKDISETDFGKDLIVQMKERLLSLSVELEKVIHKTDEKTEFLTRREILEQMNDKMKLAISKTNYDDIFHCVHEILNVDNLPRNKVSDEALREEIKDVKNKVATGIKGLMQIAYKDSSGILEDLNSSLKFIELITDIVLRLDTEYSSEKRKQNAVDFSDYEHLAIKALEDENILKKYREKYAEIYIDEYQDTSALQEKILQMVSNNNLVMVGDVKQSIYGFRNAKPELFSAKYEEYKEQGDVQAEDACKIVLAQNFRSRKSVIDGINYIFEKLMSVNFGGAMYTKKEALIYSDMYPEDDKSKHKIELNIIETGKEKENSDVTGESEDGEEGKVDEYLEELSGISIEAQYVAKRINNLINSSYEVYDLKLGMYRKCEYKDIVILMKTVDKTAPVVSEVLKRNDIPVFADGRVGFYHTDEINLIISFLKILDNYYDDISLVSVMYSIIGGFNLDELVEIREVKKNAYMMNSLKEFMDKSSNTDLKVKVANFLDLIAKYKKYVMIYKVSEVLVKMYLETGIYNSMKLEKNGKLKCTNLDAFVQIAYEFESSKSTSLYEYIRYIDNVKEKSSSGDSPKILGENENVVRIMTIHKSKGLEFPVVILMNTASMYNLRDTSEGMLTDEKFGIGINVYDPNLNITYPSIIRQVIKAKIKDSLVSESLRLLYVAMTRAKEKLIIYGSVKDYIKYVGETVSDDSETVKAISPVISKTYNSHLKCITQAIALGSNASDIFDVNVMSAGQDLKEVKVEDSSSFVMNRNESVVKKFEKLVRENNIVLDENCVKLLRERLDKKYEYELSKGIRQKLTATGIKEAVVSGEEKGKYVTFMNLKPEVLEGRISEVSYGTFVHSVIEHLDFSNISEESIKSQVIKDSIILKLDKRIDVNKVTRGIIEFFESDFGNILKDSKKVEKELEFVVLDDLKDYEEIKLEEETLIQGVVDLYVETNDGRNIIIDLKTDRVQDENELIQKYKYQLYVYKSGIEVSKNVKVSNMYIYSFSLKKLIEVL